MRSRAFPKKPAAFSLLELVVVIAILSALLVAGVSLIGDTSSKSRAATTDSLNGLIEQGRTQAITTHSQVLLAIAEPGDLNGSTDDRCRIGLFKVKEFDGDTSTVTAELLRRWEVVNTGVALIPGAVMDLRNVMDEDQLNLTYTSSNKTISAKVHGIIFTPRGGREWPQGSGPVVFRIAEGGYRGGGQKKAMPNLRGPEKAISEDRLKIGRVIARPQRFDP